MRLKRAAVTMPTSIDPAIIRAISLDVSTAKIVTHGGSGFASTYRISSPKNSFFVKTSSSGGAAVMFEGEHASLNAIHNTVPSICPKSFAWGRLDNGGYFLVTEFLDLRGGSSKASSDRGSGMSLAEKLARLHSTQAPIPEGYSTPQFGFPATTCCGDTPQDNSYEGDWADFFAKRRLLAIVNSAEKNNGNDPELRSMIEKVNARVVPRLLRKGHLGDRNEIIPVVVHGDLWSGNKGRGSFVGRDGEDTDQAGPVEDVVYDPSATYAHNEYDFGIMKMFGGFSNSFWKEYHSIIPKTEPVEEYDDRVSLYESYHHLNHYSMFGGSYRSGAVNILKNLLRKYGND